MTVITLPGIGGSGPYHWQSLWESSDSAMKRFSPSDWDRPDLSDWCHSLQNAVTAAESPVFLVAHSLSCLLVAHWAARSDSAVVGAFLVAVPDPTLERFPLVARSFASPPTRPFRFPTLVVASTDDPYSSIEYAESCANAWRAEFVNIGAAGHINAESDLLHWSTGKALFDGFVARAISSPLSSADLT